MKISVKVITNAKVEKIEKDDGNFQVWLRSKPIGNEANIALIKIIAEHFGVQKSCVRIVSGLKNRHKILEVILDGA